MTGLAVIDGDLPRRELLLASLRRVMGELFGDLLAKGEVANVLVLPPSAHGGNCRVLVKDGPVPVFVREVDPDRVRRFLAYVAGFARKELRRDHPSLDVVLPDGGERIHADIEPVTTGPACAIRQPWRGRITLTDWVAGEAITVPQANALRALVAHRVNTVIAGEVDTGKTTLLRACLEEPGPMEGLPAVLQDPYEFAPPCPNAYAMVADPWAEPPVTLEMLVANALRVPMTHLVLGEVRRAEARAMIVGWATGHPGLCTVHAGSAADALDRIAQMVGLAGIAIDELQLRWIAKAVGAVVHLVVDSDGRRRVAGIIRVEGFDAQHGFRLRPLA